jgi:hypothetical protein
MIRNLNGVNEASLWADLWIFPGKIRCGPRKKLRL